MDCANKNNPAVTSPPEPIHKTIRIICPKCGYGPRSQLGGGGWTVTWCKRCKLEYRTGNEILTPTLRGRYQIDSSTGDEDDVIDNS